MRKTTLRKRIAMRGKQLHARKKKHLRSHQRGHLAVRTTHFSANSCTLLTVLTTGGLGLTILNTSGLGLGCSAW